MRERDSAERAVAEGIAGRGVAIQTKEEAGLRINEGVTKAVEHDSGDIALGVKTGRGEHLGHLLAYFPLVVGERSGQQFRASELPLSARREPRLRKIDEEGGAG